MVLSRTPQTLRWQKHQTDVYLGYRPHSSRFDYRVSKAGEFWYWFDRQVNSGRPYLTGEDAMRGAQRHHEERAV